jgi:TetR/AcrR family transcriptional regulator, mexJK operon transcriptional repressor
MSRHTTPRAQKKRKQITDAARALFLANGYARTSMDAVTAGAGVSKQTLYSYFPSKAALLIQVVSEGMEALTFDEAVSPTFETTAGFRGALLSWADTMTSILAQDDVLRLYRLVIGEVVRLPELRDVIRETVPQRLLRQTEHMITVAAERGLVTAPHPSISARMFLGPVLSYITVDGLFRAEPAIQPDPATLAYIVDAFLAPLIGNPRP